MPRLTLVFASSIPGRLVRPYVQGCFPSAGPLQAGTTEGKEAEGKYHLTLLVNMSHDTHVS